MTKSQAEQIAIDLCRQDISATWLTGDCSETERTLKMDDWDEGKMNVLVSTFNCGIDNANVKEAIIAGGCRSIADAIQSAGRIRPRQQQGLKSPKAEAKLLQNE